MRYHITCSKLASSNCSAGYRHVSQVGYETADGTVTVSRQAMVELLDEPGNSAYTTGGGEEAEVKVLKCACGLRFLKTQPDDTKADNLRKLPDCT